MLCYAVLCYAMLRYADADGGDGDDGDDDGLFCVGEKLIVSLGEAATSKRCHHRVLHGLRDSRFCKTFQDHEVSNIVGSVFSYRSALPWHGFSTHARTHVIHSGIWPVQRAPISSESTHAMRKERLRLLSMFVCSMRAKSSRYRLIDVSWSSGLQDPAR